MRITIDTQHDTYDDIKKVLHILSGIIDQKGLGNVSSNYVAPPSAPVDTSNMMSMFDSSVSTAPAVSVKEVPNTPPDFSSFLNITGSKSVPEKRIERPQIEV